MKGKIFDVETFSNEKEMLDFINKDDYKQPISVVQDGYVFRLYYLW